MDSQTIQDTVNANNSGSSGQEYADSFISIQRLNEYGISESDLMRLREQGFHTAESVAAATRRTLEKIKGISENKADKIKCAAMRIVPMRISTASELLKIRSELVLITTGSKELDQMLRGGIETGSITEFFGEFGSGKTQMCHTLAVTCQLPVELSGGEGKCMYISTEDTFRPERLVSVALRFKLNVDQCLENITNITVNNTDQQLDIVNKMGEYFSQARYSLLVVDSAIALYRTDYCGRGELAARQQHLASFLRQLSRLCSQFGVAIVITNQVVANVDNNFPFADNLRPTGGNILGHGVTTRLYLKKRCGNSRLCQIFKSPNLPLMHANFAVTVDGITDDKETTDN